MKKRLYYLGTNFIILLVLIITALGIAGVALSQKIHDYNLLLQQGITATVEKDNVPILGLSKGIIKKIDVIEGQHVKKGDLLVETINPTLQRQVEILQQYQDNLSAQTQAAMGKTELSNNKIYSPVDGVVNDIQVTINSSIDEYYKLMFIYSDDNIKMLAYLSTDQYLAIQNLKSIPAFDARLNEDIYVLPDSLRPDQSNANANNVTHEIALYLKPLKPGDFSLLLNGEQLQLRTDSLVKQTNKPINLFISFWNRITNL